MDKKTDIKDVAKFWAGAAEMEEEDPIAALLETIEPGKKALTLGLCEQANNLMSNGHFKKAIPLLERAERIEPRIFFSSDCLAFCHVSMGELVKAIDAQRRALTAAEFDHPQGTAQLSNLLYIHGEEAEAARLAEAAMRMKVLDPGVGPLVCKALARFRRHQDIVDYVDAWTFPDESYVRLYSGIASANQGDWDRALSDLETAAGDLIAGRTATFILEQMARSRSPETVRGDWFYLTPDEVCSQAIIKVTGLRENAAWMSRRIAVDLCEAFMNEDPDRSIHMINSLSEISHPEVDNLLLDLAVWREGPETVRVLALDILLTHGKISPLTPVRAFLKGRYHLIDTW